MSAMTIAIITGSILSATAMLDLIKVFFRDLMMLQQNSYRNRSEEYTSELQSLEF